MLELMFGLRLVVLIECANLKEHSSLLQLRLDSLSFGHHSYIVTILDNK